jgi:hypothetical protein
MDTQNTEQVSKPDIFQSLQSEAEKAQRDFSATKFILEKMNSEYVEGPGNDYTKSKNKLSNLTESINQAEESIKALTVRYSELMDATDGELTPEILEVQRTRTETRETLDTRTHMLTAERLRIRKLWLQALEPAQALRDMTHQQSKHLKAFKVSGALAEALPTLSPGLAMALILDPEKTAETLKAWAEQMQESGRLPPATEQQKTVTPDLMDFERVHLQVSTDGATRSGVVSPSMFQRLKELVSLEGDEQNADEVRQLRRMFDHMDKSEFPIPGGINPHDENAWINA